MRTRGLIFSLCILTMLMIPVLSLPARAASFPAPLPAHIAMHASVRSPLALLEAVDGYVAAATRGTENEVPPGLILMVSRVWNPILMNSLDLDDAMHVIIPAAMIPNHVADFSGNLLRSLVTDTPTLVFGVSRFDDLVSAAGEHAAVARLEDAGGFAAAYSVSFSGNDKWTLVDLGEGRAAFGSAGGRMESIRSALEGWTPEHGSDAVFSIHSSVENAGGNLSAELLTLFTEKSGDIIGALTGEGMTPEAAKGMLAALERVLPELAEELGSMKDVAFDIAFADGEARFDLRARPGGGTTLAEMAGQTARAGALDTELARRLPAGASAVFITAPFAAMIPDAKGHLEKLTSMLYGDDDNNDNSDALSEAGEKAMASVNAFMDSNPGRTVAGSYVDVGKQYSLALYEVGDTEKAMRSIVGGFELFNDLFAATPEGLADGGIRLEGGMKTEGDVSYYEHRFALVNQEDMPEGLTALFDKIRFFTAPVKGGIVSASGQLTDGDFLNCLAKIGSGSEPASSLFDSARAKEMLPGLPNAQAMVGSFDAGYFFDVIAMQQVEVMTMIRRMEGEESAATVAALERMKAFLAERNDKSGELIGFGIGADNGWLTARALVPAGAVRQIVRDSGEFSKLIRQQQAEAFRENLREQKESEEYLEDEYEDEEEEYEEEPEEEFEDEEEASAEEEPAAA